MKHEGKTSIINSILRYYSSIIYRQLLGVFTVLIKPKLLTPEYFGLWNLLSILPAYASNIHLGSRQTARYLLPYNEAKGDISKNQEIESSLYYGTLYLNLVIIAVLLILFVFHRGYSDEVRYGLLTIALIVLLNWYYEYYVTLLKAYQYFNLITSANYLMASISFISLLFVYFYQIYGLYISALLSIGVAIVFLRIKHRIEILHSFSYRLFIQLIKSGFPIMVFSLVILLMMTSDRLIISYFLGNKQLGYYGIAIMAFNFIINLPSVSREVIEPRLMQDMATGSIEDNVVQYFFKPLLSMSYFMPLMIGPVMLALPVLVPLWLPRYTEGIGSSQILVLGGYFLSLSYLSRGLIVAQNWQAKASLIAVGMVFINVCLSIYLMKLMGLEGVALATSISYFAFFISLLAFIRKKLGSELKGWNLLIAGICLPFPVMCLSILSVKYILSLLTINKFLGLFVGVSAYYAVMLILVKCARKKYVLLRGFRIRELFSG